MWRFLLACMMALSTAALTTAQQITLIQPNGGESIDGCAPFEIEWTATGTSNEFNIDYSTDGGVTWVSLASFLTNTNSFSWEAPNIYSTGCLVRVYDAQAPEVTDASNSTFALNAPIQFLYPDGGETLYAGQTVQVGWMSAYYLSTVGLQLSLDNGLTWSTVATNLDGGLYEWTVPNSPSTSARLRVGTDFTSCFVDGSASAFTIVSSVTINEPNGGESIPATVVPPSYAGYYLMNNGTIVTDGGRFFDSGGPESNASNVNYTKYFWPATQNNELKMTFTRLSLYDGYSSYDDRLYVYDATTNQLLLSLQGTPSAASLHTNPPTAQGQGLKVVFQNETGYDGTASGWDANIESIDVTYDNTTYPMDWDVAGTSKEFHLDYSNDGGLTWKRIMSNYYSPTGHYDWPVPNNSGANCLVKVTDTENGAVVDLSDANFTIAPASPRLTFPNGGEAWFAGTEHEIEWVANFIPSTVVTLSYSLDSGETWTTIATTENDGSYTWLLPSTSSENARVKVATTGYEDTSDEDFNLLPHITVTHPNGGEELDGCAATTVQWQAGGTSGTYAVDLSLDGGATWTNLTTTASGSSWNWSVITNETTSDARIRVRDANDASKTDDSDAAFDLIKTEDVVMLSPNGGETWYTGEVRQLNYIKTAAANNVNLSYSTDNGTTWSTIVTSQNGGAYSWTVPNAPSTEALVRVQDQSVSCRVDASDTPFTIVSEVLINEPNGGEELTATVVPPTFGGYYIMDNGTIVTDGGRFFDSGGPESNASNVNYTKYFWPATQNNELKMTFTRLSLYDGYSSYDDRLYVYDATTNQLLLSLQGTPSAASLHTNPPTAQGQGLKVVFQNETGYDGTASGWDANIESIDVTYDNTTYPMDWDVAGTSKEFHLDYSNDGGLTWKRIMSNYYSPTGHYDWPVPNNSGANCLVKVTDTENGAVVDLSDANFTIAPASPRLTFPNGGEAWFAGTEHEIEWVANFIPSTVVTLSYSLDSGETWTTIATTENDGSYTWLLPSTASENARVKVATTGYEDTSDEDFNLLPHITVTHPNGGEELDGCAATTVQWQAGGTSGTYAVDLSLDGGATWTNLTTTASGSSWNWSVITNETTSDARIRVRDANDASKTDDSDAAFDLIKTEDVVMLSPNGGETWYTGEVRQLNYIKTAAANNVNLSYSTDNGTTWSTIVTSQNGGAYSWTVPNAPSTEALVRVQDQSVSCRVDASDTPFTIVSEVLINEPNGGEELTATVVPPTFGGYYIMDNGTIVTDGGRFFDSGGPESNASNVNYTKYFWPATQNNELKMTFTRLSLYDGYSSYDDRLYVYDATTNQLLLSLQGTPSAASLHTNPPTAQGQGLKVVFQNETGYDGTASGWDANIESIDVTYDNTTYPMDWDVAGTSKEFHLDYSNDGGLTWKRIMSNYYSPTGHYDWPVPNNSGANCLVKVTDTENGAVVDLSDANFTIAPASPRLTFPNGGEAWFAGTEHEIEWVANFIPSTVVTLSYSLDSGETWTTIATTENDGSYTWLLPSTASENARVKVATTGYEDTSDEDFNLLPHITVTSPNGGEELDGCASTNVQWQAGGTSGTYAIDLSLDGGATWTNLTTTASGSSWNWSVITNETTSDARIRVRDANDASKTDDSDAAFDLIKTEDVVMLSPNGGETWYTGEVRQLNYIKTAAANNVNLSYSTDNGTTWSTIVTSQNGGAYSWTVPNAPSTEALVRVQDQSVSCRVDASDTPFTIVSEVLINEPNGGEELTATVVPPTFGGYYIMDNGTIVTDGGRFFDSGGPESNASNVNYTKYFWPATQNNELKMTFTRLSLYDGYSSYDDRLYVYDATTNQLLLSLQGTPSAASLHTNPPTAQGQGLKVVFQNETGYDGTASGWDANIESIDVTYDNTTYPMDWDVAGTSKEFHLDYSNDGGLTWKRIMSNYYSPTGHYDWPVPNNSGANCLVKVTDTENGAVVDLSDANFTIAPASPRLTFPNGGEAWFAGTEHEIEWVANFIPSTVVTLSYSLDSGDTWTTIATTENDGSYTWLLPSTASENARVKVATTGYEDTSDEDFNLLPHITVTSPNGGEELDGCASTNVQWQAGGTSGTYAIDLSLDGGATWTNLTTTASGSSWNWSVITNETTSDARIRVRDANDASKTDDSDTAFDLIKTEDVVMLSPNGGETWYTGEVRQLNYIKTAAANNVNLSYSTDNGTTWSTIVTSQNGGAYSWTVPNAPSTEALVRVQDQSVSCRVDASDTPFTIVSEVLINEPNGGEELTATVVPPTFGGYYIMDNGTIVTDGGRFFDSGGPESNASNVNYTKYFWPATQNNELKMTFTRLSLYDGYSSYDDRLYVYDATTNQLLLSLQGTPSAASLHTNPPTAQGQGLKVVFQNETGYDGTASGWDANIESIDVTYDNTTYPMDWDVAGTSKEFHLDYSNDGGLTWKRIMSNYYSPTGHYDWPVPNNSGANCLVKVTDTENGAVVDLSDANFTIAPASPRLTFPNGGEAWFAGTEHEIEWVANFIPSTVVTLSYSLDSGETWTTIATTENDGSYTWLLPSTASENARVKVATTGYEDTSDEDFNLLPHITVTHPNGGEELDGCAATTVQWQAGGTSGTYAVDLSLDGGATWTNLTTTASGSSWNWSVITNETTSDARIRVRDANDASKTDDSDAAFDLMKTEEVVMLSPNGGEVWNAGEVRPLNYLKSPVVGAVNLAYSLDAGESWTTIASSQTDGSYSWTVPNAPSAQAFVRVQDQSVTCRNDANDVAFTIVSEVAVNEPNGGELYQATVMPAAFGGVYLMDNGSITTDGGRFYDSGGPQGNASNTNYTKHFYPATAGNELKMTFTRLALYDGYSSYDDRLYVYDATTNQLLLNLQGSPSASSLQTNPPTAQAPALKVVFQNETGYDGTAAGWDANLESINVEDDDTTQPIDWDVAGTSKEFNLEYSTNGGITWTRIVSNYYSPTGHYDWAVPNAPSTACKVRVVDVANGQVMDESDYVFTIVAGTPAILIQHPNTATTVHIGSVEDITWESQFLSTPYVAIDYSTDNGATWQVISASTLNDGVFEWLVPDDPTSLALVRIRDAGNNVVADVSDIGFTIAPPIALETQNTFAADYRSCTYTNIDWFAGGTSGVYDIDYSTDGGDTWTAIASDYVNGSGFISYNWLIPNTPSTTALVRVRDANAPSKFDVSDNVFTISPTVELTSFTYGGVATAGSEVAITWNDTLTSNFWDLAYSLDAGGSWTTIVENHYTLSGSYAWSVPFGASAFAMVRVEDANNACKSSESVLPFDLTAYEPSVQVVSPNGGESFTGCSDVTLVWEDLSTNNAFNIDYRPTPASAWISIATNVSAPDRTYTWTLPNEPMGQASVRVRAYSNSNNFDVSDWYFTTTAGVDVEIASSTGSFEACSGDALVLTASGAQDWAWSTGATGAELPVSASGTYEVTGTTGGCVGTASVTVTVAPTPPAPVIGFDGPSVVCEGETVVLTATLGAGSVYWPELGVGAEQVVVTEAGTYHATATVGGCTAVSEPVTVEVLPVPTLVGLATNSPVFEGSALQLTVSPGAGANVTWSGPDGFEATTANVELAPATEAMSGVYAVTASALGCAADTLYAEVEVWPVSGGTGGLSGGVLTPQGFPVEGVEVTAQAAATGAVANAVSDASGGFGLALNEGNSYWVSAMKATDDPADNGVTTLDILLAQGQILGQPLSTPWQLLAADVNGSGTVTTLDLLLMQQVILQQAATYPGVDDWVLVPDEVQFADPTNPYGFLEEVLVPTLQDGAVVDFTAVKRGDVDGSWAPMGGMPVNELDLPLGATATALGNGLHAVTLATEDVLRGLQFTVAWPADWALVDWTLHDAAMRTNPAMHASGRFPFQFASETQFSGSLVTWVFDVPEGASWDELGLTSVGVPGEACGVDLAVSRPVWSGVLEALQVEEMERALEAWPNPTSDGFTLALPGLTGLDVSDAAGRLVDVAWRRTAEGAVVEAMPAAGTYVVRATTSEGAWSIQVHVVR